MSSKGRKSTEPVAVVEEPAAPVVVAKPVKHAPVRGKPVSGRVWKDDLGLQEKYVALLDQFSSSLLCFAPVVSGQVLVS